MMSIEAFNPVLLKASYFNGYGLKHETKLHTRVVYDYEIEYYIESEGAVVVDGERVDFSRGDIGILKPGQKVYGIMPYSCYLIVFDLKGNYKKRDGYILGSYESMQEFIQSPIISGLPHHIPAHKNQYAGLLIKKIYEESLDQTEVGKLGIKANLMLLLKALFESVNQTESMFPKGHHSIKEAARHIRENYTEEIKIKDLVQQSGFSKAYFYKLFQSYTGMTPNQLMIHLRLEKAKYLLSVSEQSITEVGCQCGYYDSVYFSYVFKRYVGQAPSEFRKQNFN